MSPDELKQAEIEALAKVIAESTCLVLPCGSADVCACRRTAIAAHEAAARVREGALKWEPIESAPKGSVILAGAWQAEQGGFDWQILETWFSGGEWRGHPTHWLSGMTWPPLPPQPGAAR